VALLSCTPTPAWAPWEAAPQGAVDLSNIACIAGQVPADAGAFLAQLDALSVKRFRWEIPWATLERSRGVFDFSVGDARVQALAAAGVDQLLILDYGNPLYSVAGAAANDATYPPDDPADFGRYVTALVTRYGATVKHWEVWNEENSGFRFWKPQADPGAYAKLLEVAFHAVKAACADCEVLVGAPISLDYPGQGVKAGPDFLRAVRAGGGVDGDAVGVHPYTLYPPCSPPEGGSNLCELWTTRPEVSFAEQIDGMVDAGDGRPFHATEFGWATFTPPRAVGVVTEELQAQWLVRGALAIASRGARSACWYTLQDDASAGTSPVVPEGDFGLVKYEGGNKRSFQAYAELFGDLHLLHFIRDRAAELGLQRFEHALLFETGRGLTTFLWREERAAAREVTFTLFGPSTATQPGWGPAQGVVLKGATATLTLAPAPVAITSTR
jgi:hypothetical protein